MVIQNHKIKEAYKDKPIKTKKKNNILSGSHTRVNILRLKINMDKYLVTRIIKPNANIHDIFFKKL